MPDSKDEFVAKLGHIIEAHLDVLRSAPSLSDVLKAFLKKHGRTS